MVKNTVQRAGNEIRQQLYRQIPKVDQLLLRPVIAEWSARAGHAVVIAEIQNLLGEVRAGIGANPESAAATVALPRLENELISRLRARLQPGLRTVINATGVILHTNLGRAPLSLASRDNLSAFAVSYANIEYDISTGKRWQRDQTIQELLRETLGCAAATVVNNNAAAVFLTLNSLARGREVIVSRGELVEIGGSFRVPDVMAASGAILREVGTTNKTHLADYENAITADTALILRIHPSNFRISGFTARPAIAELVELGRRRHIPVVEDIGSGSLLDLRPYGILDEPRVQESLEAGIDLVLFSGDKLLGGPQAGIIAGAEALVAPIRKNPLMRCWRVDKLVYGALQATLDSYRRGRALEEIPVVYMIAMTPDVIGRRARNCARRLKGALPADVQVNIIDGASVIGGGSCPECQLPTKLLALTSERARPAGLQERLRLGNPAVIIRVEADKALIDLRTVFPEQEAALLSAIVLAAHG